MKYWISYLVAAVFAVLTMALTSFAETHTALMDMIYPYISRLIMTTMAEWSAGGGLVYRKVLIWCIVCGSIFFAMICVFKWNLIQWIGWALAAVSLGVMINTGIYELNAYTSPLADDMRLEVTSYTISELSEAATYYRDEANKLALTVPRDGTGKPQFGTFEELALQAGDGFETMTYDKAVSVFAGSTVPVKEQQWFIEDGVSGMTVPLTGESVVNPNVPTVALPFAMCKEMAHRMCIYSEIDANFAAFLTASNNESLAFRYSAYVMAYYYCYEAMSNIGTSTAQACAQKLEKGVSALVMQDLQECRDFYRQTPDEAKNKLADIPLEEKSDLLTFSRYTSTTDLLASWYIQEYILPKHSEEEVQFDPYDPTQVDLSGIVNAPTAVIP